jgi:hypothetical protein
LRGHQAEWEPGWYLVALRRVLAPALEARRAWVPELRAMLDHARQGDTPALTAAAGRIGAGYGVTFRQCRDGLDALSPPRNWRACHDSARAWFDQLVAACAALETIGPSGDTAPLREANDRLVAASELAARFNDEYERLSAPLRMQGFFLRDLGFAPRG